MARQSNTTTDHEVIKEWVEFRNGKPSVVTKNGEETELLRLNFPGFSEGDLKEISWDKWFDIFEKNKLALLYQDETSEGVKSSFNKIVSR